MLKIPKYVIVTPARNEEAHIEKTIQSVVSQTILPKKWVIVSDGSTDCTEEIVNKYSSKYNFIKLVRVQSNGIRDFSSKVYAFNAGYQRLKNIEYDIVGNLDADVSFESDYFECILEKFNSNEKLGIAGGWICELQDGKNKERFGNSNRSVPGAIQLFRRRCYDNIGGYIPLKLGGEDALVEIKSRMYNWEVKSFPDIKVFHHRDTGTVKGNILFARFRQGKVEYLLGYHPLFEIAKCFYRVIEKPYFIGSLFRIFGYLGAFLRNEQQGIPDDVVKYLQREQLQRLKTLFKKM